MSVINQGARNRILYANCNAMTQFMKADYCDVKTNNVANFRKLFIKKQE